MGGRSHYLIELFGTDHAYKGCGVGSKMLKKACDIADETGDDIFVQANASAIGFYEKFGFKSEGEVLMPGEDEYLETFMVRRV
jgi:ribosomal protein S18 acetylase RimI-like enzyme